MRCPRWPALTRCLPDGRLEIDNNIAERAMRAVEIAKCDRHNPSLWLTHVLEAIGRQREKHRLRCAHALDHDPGHCNVLRGRSPAACASIGYRQCKIREYSSSIEF